MVKIKSKLKNHLYYKKTIKKSCVNLELCIFLCFVRR